MTFPVKAWEMGIISDLISDEVESLVADNKRLRKLAHDLQQEIERHVLAEIHPMEDK